MMGSSELGFEWEISGMGSLEWWVRWNGTDGVWWVWGMDFRKFQGWVWWDAQIGVSSYSG